MTVSRVGARKQKIFRSVFQTDVSQPTPHLPNTEPGAPFGGPASAAPPEHILLTEGKPTRSQLKRPQGSQHRTSKSHSLASNGDDQVRWDRAWHVVTSRILLPSSVAIEDSFGTLAPESQDYDPAFYESLHIVLDPKNEVPRASHTEDILLWHTKQVRQHFVHHVLPLLAACSSQNEPTNILQSSIQTLEAAHRQYLHGLSLILRGHEDHQSRASSAAMIQFQKDLHAIVGGSWTQEFTGALHRVLHQLLSTILDVEKPESRKGKAPIKQGNPRASASQDTLLNLMETLQKVGLVGERFKVIFAETMDQCMEEYIRNTYAGIWETTPFESSHSQKDSAQTCTEHLGDWVENQFSRVAVQVFDRLGRRVAYADVERWREVALNRLAALRMRELFDIVLHWPESKGGLDDLSLAVATPQRRLQLTDTFSTILQERLLHPGRSTLNILRTYVSLIRTFHALDHSKVLLDRVVHALQLYLCQRDDAIRIVVVGLLANPNNSETDENQNKLIELARILGEPAQSNRRYAEDDDLDWDNMAWLPDPVDAGVNYKRPKNEDVIGTLISALGSQDIFIKEFQLIIAERLLSSQTSFLQENKVLGLLKRRFGDNTLQNCEVMLRDIQDSKRVDSTIRKGIQSRTSDELLHYHSKILSRLFWPSLPNESFQVPPPVAEIRNLYEAGFEQLKTSRKLTWLDNLGTARVKLELEDRTVDVECKTYEAAVIYAFQSESQSPDPQKRTFDEIWQHLMIDEDLLEAALKYWVSKRVLRDTGGRAYVVLERLDHAPTAAESSAETVTAGSSGAQGSSTSPKKAKGLDAKEKERRTVYWQFIVGMLTNSSPAMPLGQIAMMMKMLIADGCPWSNEELQEFLGEKVQGGELEYAGGKYRLPKK